MKFKAPLLIPTLGIVAGILAGKCGAELWSSLLTIILACAIYFTISYLSKNPVRAYRLGAFHQVWIFLLFAGLAIFSYQVNASRTQEIDDRENVVAIIGHVKEITHPTSGDRAEVEISRVIYSDGTTKEMNDVSVILYADLLDASVDDMIVVKGKPEEITDSPNHFESDYAARQKAKGILYSVRSLREDISIAGHRTTLRGMSIKIRDRLEAGIEKSGLSRNVTDFLITILLGDRSFLNPDMRKEFADAGISHILALSGMHIAIISMIILWFLFPMNISGHYRERLVLTCILLGAYTFITGMQPSTVRAALMIMAVTICVCLERKNSAWNSLLFATSIILLANPQSLFDPGLQLSFVSVASLIFFANQLNPFGHHDNPRLFRVYAMILATVTATFGTWCISSYYFEQIPVMFLPANIVILPLLPYFIIICLFYLLLSGLGVNFALLGEIIDRAFNLMIRFVDMITNNATTAIHVHASGLSVILWLLLTIILAVLVNGIRNRKRIIASVVLAGLFIGSFANDIVYNREKDGFIIRSDLDRVAILTRRNGLEDMIHMKSGGISECELTGKKIVCIDSDGKGISRELPIGCDILILTSGCKEGISEVIKMYEPQLIVIHPSVRRKRENELLAEADRLGKQIHSIRHDGPLKVME